MNRPAQAPVVSGPVLPVTSHALKRQAKRAQHELKALLTSPPAEVTLSFAQEFVSRLWGQEHWHDIRTSETRPSVDGLVGVHVLHRIGRARAMSLLGVLLEPGSDAASARRMAMLADLVIDLEFAKAEWIHGRAVSHIEGAGGAEIWAHVPFSFASLSALLRLDNLDFLAWCWAWKRDRNDDGEIAGIIDRLRAYLGGLPAYDPARAGKKPQAEDTRLQHQYVCEEISRALHRIDEVERCNPDLWRAPWLVDKHEGSFLGTWPLLGESWLGEEKDQMPPGEAFVDFLRRGAERHGGAFNAVHGLEWLSYGAQSRWSRTLLKWLKAPHLVKEMVQDLEAFLGVAR